MIYEVEYDGSQAAHDDPAFCYDLDAFRNDRKHFRNDCHAESHAYGDCHYHQVSLIGEIDTAEHFDAVSNHHSEHREHRTAEDGSGDGNGDCPDFGYKTEQNQQTACDIDNLVALYAGQLDQTDIL